jgi:AraC-like DNA-binding protein
VSSWGLTGVVPMTAKIFCCQYAGETKGSRYEWWREEFGRRWIGADFSPLADDYVATELSGSEHSFVTISRMRGSSLHIDRRNDIAEDTRGHRFLIVASGCRIRASQRGRSIDLSRGDMTLLSADEPARVTQLTAGSRWSVRISQQMLADACGNIEDKITRPILSTGVTKLLLHQIETAHRFGPKLDALADHATGLYLLDLVLLCLGAADDAAHLARERGLAMARLDAIKAEILRSLSRSDLALENVAANQRISSRYVQHLFARSGTSFTGFVLEQRLLLAYRLLRDPKNRARKISDIAIAAGFSDISYFNRAFRGRFERTPKDVRASPDQETDLSQDRAFAVAVGGASSIS